MYCNPLNLKYGYQHYGKGAHCEGADPTLILYKDTYYLFVSMCGGFFYSDDLQHWKFHKNTMDLYRYAPDVREINGELVFCASTQSGKPAFWKTTEPLSDKFERITGAFNFWDPDLFQDDDGRTYLYWGCDCNRPIYVREIDSVTFQPIDEKKEMIAGDVENRGWERPIMPFETFVRKDFGQKIQGLLMKAIKRDVEKYPFVEGPYMTKINGNYYLQYAAPATEKSTYGNGVFIGDSPVGPFSYQVHNPFSLKTGGFITGAGHGSTIEDKYGNLWHAATMKISVNANFERRCGLFPAGIDKDGILFCNQNFADYPLDIPKGKFAPETVMPKWMLLSYKKKVRVSSTYKDYSAENAVNEDICTSWCANGSENEWLEMDLGDFYMVGAIQVNFADVEVPVMKVPKSERAGLESGNRYIDMDDKLATRYMLEGSTDGKDWFVIADKSQAQENLPDDFIELSELKKMRYVRVTSIELPYKKRMAINGLRVFGEGNGTVPKSVETASAEYSCDDRTVKFSWKKVTGALGYNIRYGIAPDKLYLSHMQYEKNEVELGSFQKGQKYYFSVDSFNESGIAKGTKVFVVGGENKVCQ